MFTAPQYILPMYGIIGFPLLQTFSPGYFQAKFEALGLEEQYLKFPLNHIGELKDILQQHPDLRGLNVTMPYKQQVMPLLDELDDTARAIGAVNTIAVSNGRLKGYNTDVTGFLHSLKPLLAPQHQQALILGTGGASKAVAYALDKLGIAFAFVSRNRHHAKYTYTDLDEALIRSHRLIINTTPLGMTPEEDRFSDIPYAFLSSEHLLYDLIYHPEKTRFLQKGEAQGAQIKNGYDMLIGQAEAAWDIWQQH